MKNHWYPLLFAKNLVVDHPHADSIFGEPLVLFRDRHGQVSCVADTNAHHGHSLSLGDLPTHGAHQSTGKATPVRTYPVVERGGMIWVWPGKKLAADRTLLTMADELVPPGWASVDLALDWQMDPDLAIEIILEQAHDPFAPTGPLEPTKPNPPVDLVLYHRSSGFQGCCRYPHRPAKYPLWISFTNPSTLRIDFLSKQSGPLLEQRLPPSGTQLEKLLITEEWAFLVQLFYVVPSAPGRTRILIRTLRNWATSIPFMDLWMRRLVKKTMVQDPAVLQDLQLRIEQGSSPWSCPVRADGLPLAYRRWRSGVEMAQLLD